MPQSSAAYAGKDEAKHPAPTETMKKRGSFKSLFSIFKSSKSSLHSNPDKDSSVTDAPRRANQQASDNMQSSCEDAAASTVSLPGAFSGTPPSSSSSTSSLEFESDASTAATTPSNSVPSVLMKPSDSMSSSPADEHSESSPRSKRSSMATMPESNGMRRSPLSYMSTPGPNPYILPSPPSSPILHERRNSFQPKRRNSLGRLLARGYQSNPDLSRPFDYDGAPPIPRVPSSASSRSSSLRDVSQTRSKISRKREKGRADLEKPTSYSKQERIEHQSILGADPAGFGFYLYPKTPAQELSQKNSKVDYYGGSFGSGSSGGARRSWAGMSGDNGSRRAWRDQRGRSFRGNVASQIIMEEDANDFYQEKTAVQTQRRHSESPMHGGQWRQSRLEAAAAAAPVPPLSAADNKNSSPQSPSRSTDSRLDDNRRQSLHNNWEHSNEEMALRSLQQEEMADRFGKIAPVPALKVEKVDA